MFDKTERYAAEVIGFNPDRVTIRRICPGNVTVTPTYARWGMFTDTRDGYHFLDWMKS